MSSERHVKLFKNGRSQAVRIPREFELPGEDAIMRKDGARLTIEPTPPKSLLAGLATLSPLEDDFPPSAELTLDPVRFWCAICSIPIWSASCPSPAGPSDASHPRGWRAPSVHQHHRGGGIALWGDQTRLASAHGATGCDSRCA